MSDMLARAVICLAVLCLAILSPAAARAQCPQITVQVDNDIAGSGYSEEKPNNWLSRPVGACYKNYRYLSHTVGDGTRKGKAIWKPKITVTGWYEVTTSYRATGNRTNDADYVLYDDVGGTRKVVVSQQHSGDCTKKVLGTIYCKAGGACRLVLDGSDDSQSDSADITTFRLAKCSGPPPANPCAGISKHDKWTVCSWTVSTCGGTYDDGAGCAKYCAAAGMICVARFGGTAPCSKEPNNKIPCGQSNSHQSDYCECAFPDAGPPPLDSAPPRADGPLSPPDGPAAVHDRAAAAADAPADSAGPPPPLPRETITSGCTCRAGGGGQGGFGLLVLLLGLRLWRRRR